MVSCALHKLRDYDKDTENTAEIISLGAVTMLKAICNVQKTILDIPKGIIDKGDFSEQSRISQESDQRKSIISK